MRGAWKEDAHGRRERMRVAPAAPLHEMEGIAGVNFLVAPLKDRLIHQLSKLGVTNWSRRAAHVYMLAAGGHLHFLFDKRLMPWDHAAGWLLHRETSGVSAHFDGTGYAPWHTSGGLLCAPDAGAWRRIRETLLGPLPT